MRKLFCFIGFMVLLLAFNASALLFKDSQNNLYLSKNGKLFINANKGEGWTTYNSPTSQEVKLIETPDNQLYLAWIEDLKLNVSNLKTVRKPESAIKIDKLPDYWEIKAKDGRLHLIYTLANFLYYQNSDNYGRTFSPARLLNENLPLSLNPKIDIKDGLKICFASKDKIYLLTSGDNGQNFTSPLNIYSTKNEIQQLVFRLNQLLISEKESENSYSLFSSSTSPPLLIQPLLTSQNPIINLEAITNDHQKLVIYYNERDLLKYAVVGQNLKVTSRNMTDYLPANLNFEGLVQIKDVLYSIWSKNEEIQILPVLNHPPSSPALIDFKPDLNTSRINIKSQSSDPDQDPVYYRAQISWDENFTPVKTWTFENLTSEAEIISPLPDGKYYLRVYALDGLSQSPPSAVQIFIIDREPPQISLDPLQPTTNQALQEIKGVLSEKSVLSVNQELVGLSGGLKFSKSLPLSAGENRMVLCATDEAGNSTSEVISINYNQDAPIISITKPKAIDWFKKEGTVFIEAAVSDNQNDIEDEKEAEISIDNILLSQTLLYDKGTHSLSGFVPLLPIYRMEII